MPAEPPIFIGGYLHYFYGIVDTYSSIDYYNIMYEGHEGVESKIASINKLLPRLLGKGVENIDYEIVPFQRGKDKFVLEIHITFDAAKISKGSKSFDKEYVDILFNKFGPTIQKTMGYLGIPELRGAISYDADFVIKDIINYHIYEREVKALGEFIKRKYGVTGKPHVSFPDEMSVFDTFGDEDGCMDLLYIQFSTEDITDTTFNVSNINTNDAGVAQIIFTHILDDIATYKEQFPLLYHIDCKNWNFGTAK